MVARRFQASVKSGRRSITALSSLIARSKSLLSVACLARPIKRLAVSLLAASQIAQMRFSTYLALSSSGATLSASNSRSRLCALSPVCARGSVLGGSIGLGGSGSTASALTGHEATLGLVDHVDPAFAPHHAIVAMAAAQRFQGIADFHAVTLVPIYGAAAAASARKLGTHRHRV